MDRILLVGSNGVWGKLQAKLLQAKATQGLIDLILIDIDDNPVMHSLNTTYFNWNTDGDKIAQLDDIDVVIICCPDALHFPMTKTFIERCRSLFIEKPLCLSSDDLSEFQRLLLPPAT